MPLALYIHLRAYPGPAPWDTGTMADPVVSSPVLGRRELQVPSLQRRKPERHARERMRNVALAAVAAAAIAAVLGLGVSANWGQLSVGAPARPLDPQMRAFAATRIARILIPDTDDDMCRELEFSNDTGTFLRGRMVRCQDVVSGVIEPLAGDASGRGAQVRAFFSKR